MNIKYIYNRLQHDVSSILGFTPQLDISRASLYEKLWRDMLVLIERIGVFPHVVHIMSLDGEALCYDSYYAQSPYGDTCVVLVTRISGSQIQSDQISVPTELAALVLRFLGTGSSSILRTLRQVCLFTYKSKSHEVTEEQEITAIEGFSSRNTACLSMSPSWYRQKALAMDDRSRALKLARLLAGIVIDRCDFRNIRPSHGPGAVSDAKRGYDKWTKLDSATTRLCDKYYPLSEWFVPTPEWFDHHSARYTHSVCKLAIVPKDKRGPRVICTQPVGLMWIQQGQLRSLNKTIESSAILQTNRLINGESSCSIKFDKQEQNGSLALESSRTREFATIDLKDASDLVSWGLVRYLFNKYNVQYLAASRAMYVRIRGKQERLHMYAPMGSAMCFPIESLVFWCVAAAATYVQRGVTYEYLTGGSATKFLRSNLSEVFVFGDDVLVRRESCKFVCECFEFLGFKPNYNKTFAEGLYRESCGVDAYNGERLDISRLQCPTLTSMSDAYATIDLANRARWNGLASLADYLECNVESYLGFGVAAGLSPGGSLWSRGWPCDSQGADIALRWNVLHNKRIRFNIRYQYWEAQSVIARPLSHKQPLDGRCRLFRGLTSGVDEHTVDWLKPDNMQYHLGWVRAF